MQKLVMLTKTDEFSSVFSFRKRVSQTFITLHYLPKTKLVIEADSLSINAAYESTTVEKSNVVRVGFVVAKRVAKRAVDRNYIRRVLRMICRKQLPVLRDDVDLIIQVQKPFTNTDYANVATEMASLLAKVQRRILSMQASPNGQSA